MSGDPHEPRQRAWSDIHDLLPEGWRVGPTSHQYLVTGPTVADVTTLAGHAGLLLSVEADALRVAERRNSPSRLTPELRRDVDDLAPLIVAALGGRRVACATTGCHELPDRLTLGDARPLCPTHAATPVRATVEAPIWLKDIELPAVYDRDAVLDEETKRALRRANQEMFMAGAVAVQALDP
jgi:hypothetical protein